MLLVIAKTLKQIIAKYINNKPFTLHVNNRYLLAGVTAQFPAEKREEIYGLLDRFYKITPEKFAEEMNVLLGKDTKKMLEFTSYSLEKLPKDLVDNDEYRRGYTELQEVFTSLKMLNLKNEYKIVFDPYIIRGLDYYTGTVYEAFLDEDIALGSISAGGRYENLTGYINPKKKNFSGVGGSIGLSRLMFLILENYTLAYTTQTKYLFVNFAETIKETTSLMLDFAKDGTCVELYPTADKLGKQF